VPSRCKISLDGAAGGWRLPFALTETPTLILRCDGPEAPARLFDAGRVARNWGDPLGGLDWLQTAGGPPGAWVGCLSYELGALLEDAGPRRPARPELPLYAFAFVPADRGEMPTREADVGLNEKKIDNSPENTERDAGELLRAVSNFSRREYELAVARVIEYIRAGDIFQANLSQRLTAPLIEPAADIYRRLRRGAPAPFGAYLDFGDHALLCNSPELFLRVEPAPTIASGDAGSTQPDQPVPAGRRIITRPIKGTRPTSPGMEEQLRHSEKDTAELNMIVDLERNDLGRVCRIGSVRVSQPRSIERHGSVFHGVATVEGRLRDDVGFVDLLRAVFPGGSITGAPKIRAMQIIHELERIPRGPYCGAIGYIATTGHIEFNVAIRTMIAHENKIHIPVGGGIVADSVPADEYEETLVKARSMLEAVGATLGE
jgi:para-aminobenzoate synthetase component 1